MGRQAGRQAGLVRLQVVAGERPGKRLRALGPTGKCAPELGRKQNRARVPGRPGHPGMGTRCTWSRSTQGRGTLCSSGPFQQVLLGADSGLGFTSAPHHWALENQVTLRNPTGPPTAALVTGGRDLGETSARLFLVLPVWMCCVRLGPPSPGLSAGRHAGRSPRPCELRRSLGL